MDKKCLLVRSLLAGAALFVGTPGAGAAVLGDYAFADRSGTTADDASPANNDATLQGFTTTPDAGDAGASGWTSGGQLRFDGVDDRVSTPINVTGLANSFTVESVFTYTGPANRTWTPVFGSTQDPYAGGEIFYVGKTANSTNLTINVGGLADYNFAAPALFDGQQHHLAVVFDGAADQIRTYVDGALADTRTGVTGTFTGTGDTLLIGGSGHATNERWVGLMDHVRVSTDVLGPGQFIPEPASVAAASVVAAALLLRRRRRECR